MNTAEPALDPQFKRLLEAMQLLHREARLLDEEQWREWLALFTPDVHYWIPAVQSRYRRDGGVTIDPAAIAFIDDAHADLARRIARFEQDTAWAEDPPTRCAHVVSNVEVLAAESDDRWEVRSLLTLHRCRNDVEIYQTVARRHDAVRRTEQGLKIARRRVVLLESVLLAKNLNTFL